MGELTFRIKEATPKDSTEILPLLLAQYNEDYAQETEEEKRFIENLAQDRIQEYFAPDNPGKVYLLQTGTQTSGIIYTLPNNEHGNWYVTDFYIEKDQRGRNFGEELLKACEDHVHTQIATKMSLNVVTDAPKLKDWYEKNGFLVQHFETANGSTDVDPTIKCPTHLMQKTLALYI